MSGDGSNGHGNGELPKDDLFPASGRRVKVMILSGAAIFGYLKGLDGRGMFRLYGMPADCHLVGTAMPEPGRIAFLLESQEWPIVSDVSGHPLEEVTFQVLTGVLPDGMRLEPPKKSPLDDKLRLLS
jgi:hypothetical protein